MADRVDIGEIERSSREERLGMAVHRSLVDWVGRGFREDLKHLLKENGVNRDIHLANLMGNFTRALDVFVKDKVCTEWHGRLVDTLFGEGDISVVNCLGREKRGRVEEELLGPISVLTFADLLRRSCPDFENVAMAEIVTPGETDVRNKVDLILRSGREVSLIQLKSVSENNVYVEKIDPEQLRSDYFQVVSRRDAEQMLQLAHLLSNSRENKGKRVCCYVLVVPQFDSRVIGNVFGKVRKDSEGDRLVADFGQKAKEIGLIPQ